MSLKVDGASHTECSMKAIRNGYELFCAAASLVHTAVRFTVHDMC